MHVAAPVKGTKGMSNICIISQVNTHSAEKNGFGVSAWLNSPRHSSSNASRGLKPCRTCAVYRMGWPLGQAPGYFDLLVMRPIRRFA